MEAERYQNLDEYYAARAGRPGFPSDYATLYNEGRVYRLMVMSDTHDVVVEEVGGGRVEVLGRVHQPEVVEAILDPLWANHELKETRLGLAEVTQAFLARPESVEAERALIDVYRERQGQSDALLKEGRRASYAVVAVDDLPRTATDSLHRRDSVDYGAADWDKLARVAASYFATGSDPLDPEAIRSHGRAAGLSLTENNWLESLFVDPITLSEVGYGNGRHRTEACRAAGASHVIVDTRSEMPAARKRALLVRAGAPVLELSSLDQAPDAASLAAGLSVGVEI